MFLQSPIFLGGAAILACVLSVQAATIGVVNIPTGTTDTDTGAHLTVVVTSWDGDVDGDNTDGMGTNGLGTQAILPDGHTLTSWSFVNEASGTSAGAAVTPLILKATGGTGFEIVSIGVSSTGSGGVFTPTVGTSLIPTDGDDYYAGFYMPVPNNTGGGANHAPIGFVGAFGSSGVDGGSIVFDNTTAGPPVAGGAISSNGLSPLDRTYNFQVVTIPEPSVGLLGFLGLGLTLRRRRR